MLSGKPYKSKKSTFLKTKPMKKLFLSIAATGIMFTMSAQNTYELDKNHARLGFSVMHFAISKVEGSFKDFTATFTSSKEDFSDAVIEMEAEAKSIDTDNDMRDKDLRSENWFDVTKYPKITFKSTSFKKVKDKSYKLAGNITIHGITKPIVFNVLYNGKSLNPMSKKNSVGFTVEGKLNRKDFVVGTDAFNGVVGDEVEVRSNVEFILSKEMADAGKTNR
jgi:polyisoprenoid-binding protein YceI